MIIWNPMFWISTTRVYRVNYKVVRNTQHIYLVLYQLCFKWYIDLRAAADYANCANQDSLHREWLASEIPELRSSVENYFMLISEMLVKV